MPDLDTVKEGVTRKLGPLPVWGWAVAVAGAVIGFRILSGRSAFPASTPSSSSGGTPLGGGSGADTPTAVPTEPTDISGLTTQIEDLFAGLTSAQTTIAGLSTGVTNANAFNNLQQQLIDALNKRASALSTRDRNARAVADTAMQYKDKKITKSTYLANTKKYNAAIAQQNTILADLDKAIAGFQKQISGIGATS